MNSIDGNTLIHHPVSSVFETNARRNRKYLVLIANNSSSDCEIKGHVHVTCNHSSKIYELNLNLQNKAIVSSVEVEGSNILHKNTYQLICVE